MCVSELAATGEHLHQSRRQRLECLDESQSRERGQIRGLDDDGIAAADRRRCLPAQQAQRIVERQDDDDDAERLLDREVKLRIDGGAEHLAKLVTCNLGVVVHGRHRPAHLVRRLFICLAHFAREHLGDDRPVLPHGLRHFVQHFRATVIVDLVPALLRRIGDPHRLIDFRDGRVRVAADDLFGGRIDDLGAAISARGAQFAPDVVMAAELAEQRIHAHGHSCRATRACDWISVSAGHGLVFPVPAAAVVILLI